ncbi:hypothetical protein [Listeria newyorkensis]|uniref:hypothetical protein n=1 Tax=Listeria newyorkensis TaxID=1497681 RepID=UPI0010F98F8B|nr:hypothetical protein [Listeria newyorkensis]
MRTKEKVLYDNLVRTRAAVKEKMQTVNSDIEKEILGEEHSNLTTQINSLRRYLPPKKRNKGSSRQVSGAPKTLYATVVPAAKRQQKRSYVKKRGIISRPVPFTLQHLLLMPVAFIKDFAGEEYIFYSSLHHFNRQYAIYAKARTTVPIETLFQQTRNIRTRENRVIASRKNVTAPLLRR